MTLRTLRKALSTRKTSSRTTKSPTHQMGASPPKKNIQRHSSKFWTSACVTWQMNPLRHDSRYNAYRCAIHCMCTRFLVRIHKDAIFLLPCGQAGASQTHLQDHLLRILSCMVQRKVSY